MQYTKKISIFLFALVLTLNVSFLPVTAAPTKTPEKKVEQAKYDYISVEALSLVNNPKLYLNKRVKLNATFDKFSIIGLDYEPAFRDSQNYISFLIKRDDAKDHQIPLSELKLMVKRSYAEKSLIDLELGDKIEIRGKVFSTALNDPWVEVEEVIILTPKKPKAIKTP
jgi:lysyl-tRNA synthetase class II